MCVLQERIDWPTWPSASSLNSPYASNAQYNSCTPHTPNTCSICADTFYHIFRSFYTICKPTTANPANVPARAYQTRGGSR